MARECPTGYACVAAYAGYDSGQCYIAEEAERYIEQQQAELGLAGSAQGESCGRLSETDEEGNERTYFQSCRSPLTCAYFPDSTQGVCESTEESGCLLPLLSLNIFGTIACFLTSIVGGIVKVFVQLSVQLMSGAIALNETIYGPASLAKVGFDVVLQFVNIFFVFGVLIIGFATMLKPVFPNFNLLNKIGKERLPQFLLAFFLVNFAFALAGMFISISDDITRSLSQMVSSSNAWRYFGTIPTMKGFLLGNIEGALQLIFVPLLTALVGVGMILTMLAIAIMFFIRWAYLTFLVIISPFVIFMEVFPVVTFKNLGSFKNWSEQFVRWLLFAPVMTFFIYIILSLSSAGLDGTASTVFGASLGLSVGRLVLQLILLIIGLQWANSLSLGGGKAVLGRADKALNAAKKWTTQTLSERLYRQPLAAVRREATQVAQERLKGPTSKENVARLLSSESPVDRLKGTTLARISGGVKKQQEAVGKQTIDAYKAEFQGLSDENIASLIPRLSGARLAVAVNRIVGKKEFSKVQAPAAKLLNPDFIRTYKGLGFKDDDLFKRLGLNVDIYEALRASPADPETIRTNISKFVDKLSPKDARQMLVGSIFVDLQDPKAVGKAVIPDPQSLSAIQENLVLEMYKKNPNLLKELMKAEGVNTSNLLSITGAAKRAAETLLETQDLQLSARLRSFAESSERKFYREGTETAAKEEEKKEPEQKSEKPEEGNKK